jgi:hypothetical protein
MLDRHWIDAAFSRLITTGAMDQSDSSVANATSAFSGRAGSTLYPRLAAHQRRIDEARDLVAPVLPRLTPCRTGAAEVVQRIAVRPPHHFIMRL